MGNTTTLSVSLPGGRRVDAKVGNHVVRTDQPKDNGGEDTAPSPFELFLTSIGTCAGIFIQGFCARRDIPYRDIRIEQRMDFSEDGTLKAVDLEVLLPAGFPEKYREAIVKVAEQRSVKKAIAAQPHFKVTTTLAQG